MSFGMVIFALELIVILAVIVVWLRSIASWLWSLVAPLAPPLVALARSSWSAMWPSPPPTADHPPPLTDAALIVILATMRRPSGRVRFTATQIATLIGGDQETIRDLVVKARKGIVEEVSPEDVTVSVVVKEG